MNEEKMNKARALYYAMFSRFFVFTIDNKRYFELIDFIDILRESPLDKSSALAFENIRAVVKSESNIAFMKEFDDIFHSPETQTVRTTASYYDEDIESGKKRIEMQNFLAKTKIRRDEKAYSDYEDHIGFIFSVMNELCELISEGEEQYKSTAHCIFEQILNEFVDKFSKELYEHENADIFKNVVVLLKSFIEFERVYLEVQTPLTEKSKPESKVKSDSLSDEEIARRERNRLLRQKGPKEEQSACPLDIAYDVEDDI
ncbi:molecular chaperone TorD family protein [Candidatus Sulfurimonas marisnigri]|uniref:Molecular chaperone TorD family protein n=2 Tax=Candidatus Sulfurimonas marisnigri TaxID=2740405 RepID=A0A7S7M2Q4_9BACT|nr:molecular chaperone TorD family protein [Candidatus Sulfurimonas marisnigri]